MRKKQFVIWHAKTDQGWNYWDLKHTSWTLEQVHSYVRRFVEKDSNQEVVLSSVTVISDKAYNHFVDMILYTPEDVLKFDKLSV
jgi:hypothetical protein